jgi:arylsulfatase A-like enzyme
MLTGGFLCLAESTRLLPAFGNLPAGETLLAVAAGWCTGGLLGAVAVGVLRLLRLARRIARGGPAGSGPGVISFVFAACVFVEILGSGGTDGSPARLLAGFVAAALALVLFEGLERRVPSLGSPPTWLVLTFVLFTAAPVFVTVRGPHDHGLGPASLLIFLAVWIVPALLALAGAGSARGRRIPLGLIAVSIVGCLVWFVAGRAAADRSPGGGALNVLLVTVDTLREDHLGCYGSESVRTPSVDRLARNGIRFENAVSPVPYTNPSHTSILTGRYPPSHGVLLNRPLPLRPGIETLADLLSERGYRTAAFVGGLTLKRTTSRLHERFQLYDDDFSPLRHLPEPWFENNMGAFLTRAVERLLLRSTVTLRERRAGRTVDLAGAWLGRNGGSPFLLWVHMFDPHGPYEPPPPYDRLYDPGYEGPPPGSWYAMTAERRGHLVADPRAVRHMEALYAGEVSYVDEQIGRLVQYLEQENLLERTVVVFTSDHGESLTEHEYYFDHGHFLYDPGLMVPLIFRLPERRDAGTVVEEQAELIDVLPTLLGVLGVPPPPGVEGRDLLAPQTGSERDGTGERVAYSAVFRGHTPDARGLMSLRTRSYKYVRTSPWWSHYNRVPEREELYDLAEDPGETVNLIGDPRSPVGFFRELCDRRWPDWLGGRAVPNAAVPEEAREALRSLGYVD